MSQSNSNDTTVEKIPPILKQLWYNACNNNLKKKQSYDDIINDFSSLLFIWAGPLAYAGASLRGGRGEPPPAKHSLMSFTLDKFK